MEQGLMGHMTQIELSRYSVNDYRGLPDVDPFEVTRGTAPVLVSAPHAVTHWRDGRIKPSDDYTGSFAELLGELCGCHVMCATAFCHADPNWDPLNESAYKQALVAYVREQGIRTVIDLHGMTSMAGVAVAVGSADGLTVAARPGLDQEVAEELAASLGPWLGRYESGIALNGALAARNENTVAQTLARECGIPALQLEVHYRFRIPSSKGMHTPASESPPLTGARALDEHSVRHNPDPACVEATVLAMAKMVRGLGQQP